MNQKVKQEKCVNKKQKKKGKGGKTRNVPGWHEA